MFEEVILIKSTSAQDEYGVTTEKETSTGKIPVEVLSVGQSEFFKAGAEGFKPDFKLKTFIGNYNGEEIAEFKGERYKIYRTFFKDSESIELYLTKKIGVV